ncbi:MAG: hypothetical protein R3Y23_01425 [Bacillota bacterium]
MKKKIILVVLCLVLTISLFAGCTESYGASAISTDYTDTTVTSNGGLAVTYGDYLYYINGYAGADVDNTFGDVLKGAIARVELDANGDPIAETNTIIVPKNVYNTVATSGLYIVGDYIYYSTPSIDKDSTGTAKTTAMWIMRTKVDGTDTEVIAKFDDYTAIYKVVDDYIVYYLSYELHIIDLNDKNFTDTMIDEEISALYMTEYEDNSNELVDAVFYTKANEDTTISSNIVYSYRAGAAEPVMLIDADCFTSLDSADSDNTRGKYYTITLVESIYTTTGIQLIYTRLDSSSNAISSGTYSYEFSIANVSEELSFNYAKEVRYSYLTSYTSFYFLSETQALVLNSTDYAILTKSTDGNWYTEQTVALISTGTAPEIVKIEVTDTNVCVYYILSSVIYKIDVLSKEAADAEYTVDIRPAESVYSGGYSTTWLSYDLIDDTIYFFNDNVLSYTYYVDLSESVNRDTYTQQAYLLSVMADSDEVAMLTA